jgi:hypothetical protein
VRIRRPDLGWDMENTSRYAFQRQIDATDAQIDKLVMSFTN